MDLPSFLLGILTGAVLPVALWLSVPCQFVADSALRPLRHRPRISPLERPSSFSVAIPSSSLCFRPMQTAGSSGKTPT